jgi:dTMP kinase
MYGTLIVIEGCDASGKSTQVKLLSEHYQSQNIPYKVLRFPERSTKIGRAIADYLLGDDPIDPKTLHCLFAANRYEFRMEILEALSLGLIVIIDRYVYSGAVYGSMSGCGGRVSPRARRETVYKYLYIYDDGATSTSS